MMRRDCEVIDFTRFGVKNISKLTNLMKLRGIMVNNGRIHREIRYFQEIFWNLIKLDDELR